jgi:hypothetical protein
MEIERRKKVALAKEKREKKRYEARYNNRRRQEITNKGR